jgi:hypothetical protein
MPQLEAWAFLLHGAIMSAAFKISVLAGILGGHQVKLDPVTMPISQETANMIKKDMQAFVDAKAINGGEQIDIHAGLPLPIRVNLAITHLDVDVNLSGDIVIEVDDDPDFVAPPPSQATVVLTGGPAEDDHAHSTATAEGMPEPATPAAPEENQGAL